MRRTRFRIRHKGMLFRSRLAISHCVAAQFSHAASIASEHIGRIYRAVLAVFKMPEAQ